MVHNVLLAALLTAAVVAAAIPPPLSSFLATSSSNPVSPEFLSNLHPDILQAMEKFATDHVGSLSPGFRPHPPNSPPPLPSFYTVAHKKFKNEAMDITNKHITVFYPVDYGEEVPAFRFLAYAHGFEGGGIQTAPVYWEMCMKIASFGYVVSLHHSCDVGCTRDDGELGFDDYYKEQLKSIEWGEMMFRSGNAAFKNLDWDSGVGVVGHSMGGQATLFSSAYNATSHNIKAAVYQHAWTEDFPVPKVPFLSMTSVFDDEADATTMGKAIYDIEGTDALTKGLVSTADYGHHESDILGINPLMAQFTVAWMKVLMEGVTQETHEHTPADGVDWEAMIFGAGETSVCGGGDGAVDEQMCVISDTR